MKLLEKIKSFLGFKKDEVLEEILNDPIQSYEMMELINTYKKAIIDAGKDNEKIEPHLKQINSKRYKLIEV